MQNLEQWFKNMDGSLTWVMLKYKKVNRVYDEITIVLSVTVYVQHIIWSTYNYSGTIELVGHCVEI